MTNNEIMDRALSNKQAVAFDYGHNMIVVDPKTIRGVEENVRQMGEYLAQMGQMLAGMQRRLNDLEEKQGRVTISHADAKRLQARIRARAQEIGEKYRLTDPESMKRFRAAIKKDVLRRYGVKDLHDLPEAALPGAESLVAGWTSIKLVMERRAEA